MKIFVSSLLVSALFFSSTGIAVAGCVGPVVNGECLSGTSVRGYDSGSGSNSGSGYQGSSGTQYQYDLNNAADRGRYSIDLDAQRRDSQNGSYDAGRNLDRLRGQSGGGYQSR